MGRLMITKYRIILHSMTFYRDYSAIYVLSNLLERMGCSCYIAPSEAISSRWIRIFNPHAVYYVTSGRSVGLMKQFPNAKFFYCAGEGAEDDDHFDEHRFIKNKAIYERVERLFLWGSHNFGNINRQIAKTPDFPVREVNEDALDKFRVVGHPRLDLVTYGARRQANNSKIKIGFIGNFSAINKYVSVNLLSSLLDNPSRHEMYRYNFGLASCFLNILETLPQDRYTFSLRPYPLEPRDTYLQTQLVQSGVLSIDDSLDYSSWLSEQDLLIGDFSSTVAQIVKAKKPYINISSLVPRSTDSYAFALIDKLKEHLENHIPKSWEQLFEFINNYHRFANYSDGLLDMLHDMHSIKNNDSTIAKIAHEIISSLQSSKRDIGHYLPAHVISRMEKIILPKEIHTYSFFKRQEIAAKSHNELGPVVDNIITDKNNKKYMDFLVQQ